MRVTSAVARKKKHNKIHKLTKGYWGARSRWYRIAKEAVARAGRYAYIARRLKKRDFRALWILRINAACRLAGLTYSQFIFRMKKKGIKLNRKILSSLAINDPAAFNSLVEKVKDNAKKEV